MLTKVNYKIVLVGDSAVGKTCVATRYVSDDFYEFQEPTIGASFMTKKVETNDKIYNDTVNLRTQSSSSTALVLAVLQLYARLVCRTWLGI